MKLGRRLPVRSDGQALISRRSGVHDHGTRGDKLTRAPQGFHDRRLPSCGSARALGMDVLIEIHDHTELE
jgi:hypothetical protein